MAIATPPRAPGIKIPGPRQVAFGVGEFLGEQGIVGGDLLKKLGTKRTPGTKPSLETIDVSGRGGGGPGKISKAELAAALARPDLRDIPNGDLTPAEATALKIVELQKAEEQNWRPLLKEPESLSDRLERHEQTRQKLNSYGAEKAADGSLTGKSKTLSDEAKAEANLINAYLDGRNYGSLPDNTKTQLRDRLEAALSGRGPNDPFRQQFEAVSSSGNQTKIDAFLDGILAKDEFRQATDNTIKGIIKSDNPQYNSQVLERGRRESERLIKDTKVDLDHTNSLIQENQRQLDDFSVDANNQPGKKLQRLDELRSSEPQVVADIKGLKTTLDQTNSELTRLSAKALQQRKSMGGVTQELIGEIEATQSSIDQLTIDLNGKQSLVTERQNLETDHNALKDEKVKLAKNKNSLEELYQNKQADLAERTREIDGLKPAGHRYEQDTTDAFKNVFEDATQTWIREHTRSVQTPIEMRPKELEDDFRNKIRQGFIQALRQQMTDYTELTYGNGNTETIESANTREIKRLHRKLLSGGDRGPQVILDELIANNSTLNQQEIKDLLAQDKTFAQSVGNEIAYTVVQEQYLNAGGVEQTDTARMLRTRWGRDIVAQYKEDAAMKKLLQDAGIQGDLSNPATQKQVENNIKQDHSFHSGFMNILFIGAALALGLGSTASEEQH